MDVVGMEGEEIGDVDRVSASSGAADPIEVGTID